jgi:hypothetical protein
MGNMRVWHNKQTIGVWRERQAVHRDYAAAFTELSKTKLRFY